MFLHLLSRGNCFNWAGRPIAAHLLTCFGQLMVVAPSRWKSVMSPGGLRNLMEEFRRRAGLVTRHSARAWQDKNVSGDTFLY